MRGLCIHARADKVVPKARREIDRGDFGGWWSSWAQLHNLRVQQECTDAQARLAARDPQSLLRRMLGPEAYPVVLRILEQDGHEPITG
jgi:hypothetical protein